MLLNDKDLVVEVFHDSLELKNTLPALRVESRSQISDFAFEDLDLNLSFGYFCIKLNFFCVRRNMERVWRLIGEFEVLTQISQSANLVHGTSFSQESMVAPD